MFALPISNFNRLVDVPDAQGAPDDDVHRLLFDCQATAGARQRYVQLQAT
jgi:hypothetical protein